MKPIKMLVGVCTASVVMTLAGCGTVMGIHQAKVDASAVATEADAMVSEGMRADPAQPGGVQVFDDQYVPTQSIELAKVDDPALLCDFNPYSSGKFGRTLQEIGSDITAKCGTPVRITPDAIAMMSGAYDKAIIGAGATGAASAQAGGTTTSGPTPMIGMIAPPPAIGGTATTFGLGGGNTDEFRNSKIIITWDGKLRPLLDALAARTGLNWKMANGVITFYYLDTRTFPVLGIPTDTVFGSDISSSSDTTSGLSGGSGGGSSGGSAGGSGQGIGGTSSSTNKLNINVAANLMKDMQNTVQMMMTPGVGRMAATFGTITVTDTPDRLAPIGDFLAGRNQANSMQARFSIRVLAVQLNNSNEIGLNLNAIYHKLTNEYDVTIANGFQGDSSATSAGINILNGNARWSGSSAVADVLRSVGKVSTVYEMPLTTLNMRAVSKRDIKSDLFVSGTSTTAIGSTTTGIQTSIEQATQTVGLSIQLLPFITPKGDEVYLQYSMSLSDAGPLTQVTSGDATAQQTHTTGSDGTQSVKLRSGQTLMVMGYRQAGSNLNQSGTGDEHFFLLGGGQSGSRTGRYIVVLITPNVQI